MAVRVAKAADQTRSGQIAEEAGLFPAAYLPEMIAPAFNGGAEAWRVHEQGGQIGGFAFARPEEMADRTWNVLAIAVDASHREQGYATALLSNLESELDARVIVIETTQLDDQDAARAFYEGKGYERQGHVKDFYGDGEDKIIFRKAIG